MGCRSGALGHQRQPSLLTLSLSAEGPVLFFPIEQQSTLSENALCEVARCSAQRIVIHPQ